MIAKYVTIIDQCCELLIRYQKLLSDALAKGGQQDDPPAVMLLRTLDFGLRTGRGMKLLVLADPANALLACSLLRGFFESAVRVLWASRTLPSADNPWSLLQKHWATEDLKWAEDAKHFPSLAEHAECIRKCRQEVLDRTDGEKLRLQIMQMLRDIQEADVAEELMDVGCRDAEFAYGNVYRLLCQPAHGHPVAIGNQKTDAWVRRASVGFVMATSWALQACCHVAAKDPKAEIDGVTKQLIDLLLEDANG